MRAIDPTATLAVQCGNGFDAGFSPLSKYSFEPIQCCPLSLGADMRRREFISLLGGAPAAWPLAARAQQPERMRRIGFLRAAPPPERELDAFLRALADRSYVQGRNFGLVPQW